MDDLYSKYTKVLVFPRNLQRGFYFAYLAFIESKHERPVGACLRINNSIIPGCNKSKTHPKYADGKEYYTIHAEMDAILKSKIRTDLSDVNIFVYRENSNGIALSKPCKYCMKHLIEYGIKRIYYTVAEFPFYREIIL